MVIRISNIDKMNSLMPDDDPSRFKFDVAVINNQADLIKTREDWLYLESLDLLSEEVLKDRLVTEMTYAGIGKYNIFEHNPDVRVGDRMPIGTTPIHVVEISVSATRASAKSAIFTSSESPLGDEWLAVAAIGQQTSFALKSGIVTLTVAEEALKSNLESWVGGYINVNHENDAEINDLEILEAKFVDPNLYFRVNDAAAELINNPSSTGRSFEIQPLRLGPENTVLEYNGLGLSVLYPPYKPACSEDMGCSQKQSAIKRTWSALIDKLKSSSSGMIEETGEFNPDKESNMKPEDIEKLTSAKFTAVAERDAALKEVETLKSSLESKETLITEGTETMASKDKEIAAQAERLKSFEAAEADAEVVRKEKQWDTMKSKLPPGSISKPEDAEVLKSKFESDPAAFAIEVADMRLENPRGESGQTYPQGASTASQSTTGVYTPGKGFGDE